jgi:hypothetical protein
MKTVLSEPGNEEPRKKRSTRDLLRIRSHSAFELDTAPSGFSNAEGERIRLERLRWQIQ